MFFWKLWFRFSAKFSEQERLLILLGWVFPAFVSSVMRIAPLANKYSWLEFFWPVWETSQDQNLIKEMQPCRAIRKNIEKLHLLIKSFQKPGLWIRAYICWHNKIWLYWGQNNVFCKKNQLVVTNIDKKTGTDFPNFTAQFVRKISNPILIISKWLKLLEKWFFLFWHWSSLEQRKKSKVKQTHQSQLSFSDFNTRYGLFSSPPFQIHVVIMQRNLAWWTNRQLWTGLFFILYSVTSRIQP